MNYRCPVCTRKLEPHGTGGMACSEGHHFLASDIRQERPKVAKVAGRTVKVAPWLPGTVLGALALLVELVEAVI